MPTRYPPSVSTDRPGTGSGRIWVRSFANTVPTRSKKSKELISTDVKNSASSYKFTFSVEIVPLCRDDLICLPPKLAKSFGNIGQLVLCHKIAGNTVHLLDPAML